MVSSLIKLPDRNKIETLSKHWNYTPLSFVMYRVCPETLGIPGRLIACGVPQRDCTISVAKSPMDPTSGSASSCAFHNNASLAVLKQHVKRNIATTKTCSGVLRLVMVIPDVSGGLVSEKLA